MSQSRFQRFSVLAGLALLWFRLIDHLRVEWTVNPQYTYGWAVPFLCLFLLWRRRSHGGGDDTRSRAAEPALRQCSISMFQRLTLVLLAFLYLPTRLIQEANPEWRLVSWALALEVIGLTCWLVSRSEATGSKSQAGTLARGIQPLAFAWPLAFFLVAVPWPTVIEAPLSQGMARADAATTAELVNLFGMPALQQGNVIEVSTGAVGIDEACSGIRSLQATLMLAVFFGEVYRLSVPRRVALCVVGFVLAFVFNVGRTTLLTCIAASKGTGAMASWHDAAGAGILVASFGCVWVLARWASRRGGERAAAKVEGRGERRDGAVGATRMEGTLLGRGAHESGTLAIGDLKFKDLGFHRRSGRMEDGKWRGARSGVWWAGLLAWVVVAEAGTEAWYRAHESQLPPPVTWSITIPRDNPASREVPLSQKVRQFLRFDEAVNGAWEESDLQFQAIFLRWKPGRTAVHLARTHTPESCLTAVGNRLISKSDVRLFEAGGLELPFRCYVFDTARGLLHVYYCLWEDQGTQRAFDSASLTYANRLAAVLAGRRLLGQRSLELAIWGAGGTAQAEEEARRVVGKMLKANAEMRQGGAKGGGNPKSEARTQRANLRQED